MKTRSLSIPVLSLSAVTLLMLAYFRSQPAQAMESIRDRDYSLVTARAQQTGESLYVIDNRSGRIAVFSYDPSARIIRPRFVAEMSTVFGQGRR